MSDLAKNDEEDFIFIFNDGRISKYTQNEILEVSPSFYYKSINNITFNKIKVPPSITKEDISSFIDVYKKGVISFNNNNSNNYMNFLEENIKILKFLQISEFFENDSFSLILINDYFIKGSKITNENALTLLKISYKKLNDLNKEGYLENYSENLDSAWFDLFMKCLDIIGCNLVNYFKDKEENFENNELSFFEKKIIDEIFEKFAKNLIINNYEIIEDDENINKNEDNNNNENNNDNKKYISISDLEHIIKFLSMNRKQNNFFDLLTNEYMKICSEENINEINNLPNPTFLLKLNVNEIETYYEEFKIENQIDSKNERKITFVVFYRKTDDSLNIGFKLSQDKNNNNNNNENNNKIFGFNIITFISSIIIEEINACQINSKSITNNKSLYNIFKMNNFSKTLLKFPSIEYLTVKIYLKSCYLHSILCSYLLNNFNNLFFDPKISKISKQFFLLILKNKNINFIVSSDKKVIAFLNWLNDEINIKEDLSEIIEVINWENVSLNLLFEFVFKYEKIISNLELEHFFISAVENREIVINNNNENISEEINEKIKKEIKENNVQIIKEIFYAAKKVNFVDLFIENKKLNKINNFEASNLMMMKNFSQANTNLNTHVQSRTNLKLNNSNNKNLNENNKILNDNNKSNDNNNNKLNDFNNNNNNKNLNDFNNNFYKTSSNFIEEEKDNKNEIDSLMNNKIIIKNSNVENDANNENNNNYIEKVIGEKEIILNQENFIKNNNNNNMKKNNNKIKKNINNNNNENLIINNYNNNKNNNNNNNNKNNLLISNNSFKNINKKNNLFFKNINNYILKKNYNTNINTIVNKTNKSNNNIFDNENNKNFNSIKSVKSKPKIISISKSKSKSKNTKKLIRNKSNLSIKSNNSEYYSSNNNEINKKKLFTDTNENIKFKKKTSTTKSSKKYLIKKRNSNNNNFNNNFTISNNNNNNNNNNKSFFNVNFNTNLNISNNYSFINNNTISNNNNNNNNNKNNNKNNLFQNFNIPINQHIDNNNNNNIFYLKKNDKKKNFNFNIYNLNNNNNSLLNQMKHLKIIKKENKHKNLNSFGNDCKFKKINFINNKK